MDSRIFSQEIGRCESQDEYETLVREHEALYVDWKGHILPLLRARGINAEAVAKGLHISKSCAVKFIRVIPAKRENVIMLAMMLRLSVEETNELLTRWAKFQRLYPKYPEDFIWIYLLTNGGSDTPWQLFQAYYSRYEALSQSCRRGEIRPSTGRAMDTKIAFQVIEQAAGGGLPAADAAECDERFADLAVRLFPSFEEGYRKLMKYIDSLFLDIEEEDDRLLGIRVSATSSRKNNPNVIFEGKWLDLYYRKMRELRQHHRVPSRTFLIVLGLRMSMDTDRINELLEMAGMGPLCPKDRLEGTIVFYLEELYCQFPTLFTRPTDLEVGPEYQNLMDYTPERSARGGVGLPKYVRLDVDDYPREDLPEYIRRRLEETNIFEADDRKAVRTFLKLL